MSVIRLLSPHVADLIAAGEVVERPASVVKELLENSFDAGAKKVTVEIQRGGMGLIRVTDDGCGMSPEDAETCFLRHATSKLRDEYGLEAIGTLGFRGEALAAIAAVSRVQLLTRQHSAEEGISLTLEGGQVVSRDPAGCPEGTTIVVRDLFYNTPARLKFMKKDSAEGSGVTGVMNRCALSHPEVSIRYLRDGKEEFQTAGDGRSDSCIYTVLGRDFARTMLPVSGSGENLTVRGFICPPAVARGSRSAQYFFLNGRSIRSQLIQAALEQAYKNVLFTGRFPACVLYLTMKLNQVDVNVHPAKTEVRFLQERAVFDAVYRTVLAGLRGEAEQPGLHWKAEAAKVPAAPEGKSEAPAQKPAVPPFGARASVPSIEAKPFSPAPALTSAAEPTRTNYASPPRSEPRSPEPEGAGMPEIVEQLVFRGSRMEYGTPKEPEVAETPAPVESTPPPPEAPAPAVGEPKPEPEALPPYRILGEAFREYILVETGEDLLVIDKHAAHERILFDRLKSQDTPAPGQLLLSPAVCDLDPEDKARLLENASLLPELGVEAEDFGGNSLMVRQLPSGFAPEEAGALLTELAEALRLGQKPGTLGSRDEALAAMACKAAVKAGWDSDPKEWVPVTEAVLRGEVKYCPHGRPVSMRLTKRQLDRNFKRT
ncbi:MAG: DNA mismatch repair endonuclease MutL [Oscillospiraceae bacterium]|nr:DNA mismatch repair endonuclease MutL [Oscillospiraceae bacterium]